MLEDHTEGQQHEITPKKQPIGVRYITLEAIRRNSKFSTNGFGVVGTK